MSDAIKDLLYRMADDELVIGHRNSEWTGLGPILEEDIAFSSIAQDQIGHAVAIYTMLHDNFSTPEPDAIAFGRDERDFKCSQFVELPIGDYAFSLMRHFLFDHAEAIRYAMLTESSFTPLAGLAKKIKGELKYHVLHGDLWVNKLGNGTEESRARMQTALNDAWPYAVGMFEAGVGENELIETKTFAGEDALREKWLATVTPILEKASLKIPQSAESKLGGRNGYHTEHLQPLINEMAEVYRLDPTAVW
jgi:ring-1,2-phenylacetyl-CoA epoxidase subunit PaaC